jgi:hypothetical protein
MELILNGLNTLLVLRLIEFALDFTMSPFQFPPIWSTHNHDRYLYLRKPALDRSFYVIFSV